MRRNNNQETRFNVLQSENDAPEFKTGADGQKFQKITVDFGKGYTYVPVEEADSDDDLAGRLAELQMIKNAANSTFNRVDLEIEDIHRQIQEKEELDRAAEEAAEARRAQEALARYMRDGSLLPNYRQQDNSSEALSVESRSVRKAPSRKKLYMGIAALSALTVGGAGAYAATDGWKNIPFAASFGIGPSNSTEKVLSAEDLIAGECATEDAGRGAAISTNEINVQADVLWPITLANGDVTKIEVADEKNPDATRNPYVQITTDSYLYACVPDAAKKDFLKVDGKSISVDLSKVTPQIKIGSNKAHDPVEPIALEEVKDEAGAIIVSKEVADAAVAAAKDPANISFLTQAVSARAGVALADPGSSLANKTKEMLNKAKPEIVTDLKAQAAALGYGDVAVEIRGDFKQDADYIGEAPKTSDKVSIDEKNLIIEPVVK